MSGRIALALVLHNHQPVGNFGWVIEDVLEHAYAPMLAALERHPRIRVGLHYSGPLLAWLADRRPAFLPRVRALVERGQVEVLGGGLAEPILPAIPAHDRVGQLAALADLVESTVGVRPRGAWLAERVWEPDLPVSLAGAGYDWTVLDDAHFRAASVPEDALWGPYITEDQGRPLTVFGTEQGLRYRVPFRPVEEVIAYLRAHATEAGDRIGMMGDDGEKFGAWPSTWEHCWGRGRWVETFFEAIEASAEWLETVRPSDWLLEHAPIGRVYLPTGSYAEMGEWALPVAERRAYAETLRRASDAEAPERRWLRGGFWRSFLVTYREINDLHKQMLRVSAAVAELPRGEASARATRHLYRGQSNDVYWHGLFGGIYLPHMRAATLGELIRAEAIADHALARETAFELRDLDLDGRDEARLSGPGQVITVELDEGSGIGSWDLRAAGHPMLAVLRRRPEAYHADLLESAEPARPGDDGDREGSERAEAPLSIHEGIRAKEADLGRRLRYDAYERRSGLLRALPPDRDPEAWAGGGDDDLGEVDGPTRVVELGANRLVTVGSRTIAGQPFEVEHRIELGGGRTDPWLAVRLTMEHRGDAAVTARLGQEWATLLLGGGGNSDAWWRIAGRSGPHDGSGQASGVELVEQGNTALGVEVRTSIERPIEAWWAPIETVSNSEGGVERTYQGSGLLLSEVVTLEPGDRWTLLTRHAAACLGNGDGGAEPSVSAARRTSAARSEAR